MLSAAFLGVFLLTTACFGGDTEVLSSGDRYAAAPGEVEEYRLGVGDKLRLTVYNEPSLTGEFSVGANGNLALPLIGEVPAAGLTIPAIVANAQQRYGDGYIRDPKVSAEVIAYRPFFILGEVRDPGQYPYTVGLTALSAVATSQGYTPRANQRVISIRREGEADEKTYLVTPNLRIYPGDVIRVGERYF
ncbi:polysaccharide biosynthesis/export family protein [Sphingomonas sp. HF-S3]|uniref:Polysaccharide biosynthesis/export family protein n=1 Tax=Sphingomonas rustica TaxID=3103142 RepID=A0ABV0B923_9SPHN